MEDLKRFWDLTYSWVIGPFMTLIETSVSDLTGMPPSLVSSIAQIIFIVMVCNALWTSVPQDWQKKLTPNPTGLGRVAFVVVGSIGWVSINFVYGTYGLATYLWGGSLPVAIRTVIAILPSTIQWMYMLNPPTDYKSRQVEKTVIIIDVLSTVFGLAVTLGTPPSEFFTLIFTSPGEVFAIVALAIIGNLYIERAIFDVVMGIRK